MLPGWPIYPHRKGVGVFHDSLIALIRTTVPALVGSLFVFLVNWGVNIDSDAQAALSAALVTVVIAVYYAGVTALERNVNPAFGWLLGVPKAPTYAPVSDVALSPQVDTGDPEEDQTIYGDEPDFEE